jgi:hypothetical protein
MDESHHSLLAGARLKGALKILLDDDPTAFTAAHGYGVGVYGYDIVVYEQTWHFRIKIMRFLGKGNLSIFRYRWKSLNMACYWSFTHSLAAVVRTSELCLRGHKLTASLQTFGRYFL